MLAPILPSPIMPSCIVSALQIVSKVDAQGAAAALRENGKIAPGLRRFDDAESVLLPRHRQILGVIASYLKENAAIRAALVGLPSGMEKARAEAKNRGHFFLIAHRMPDCLQSFFICRIHRDVAEDSKIIACAQTQYVGLQNISKVRAVKSSYILFVSEKFDATCLEKRHFRWKAPGRFILAGKLARFELAGFDGRLIERIDADNRTGDGRGDFPAEEFLAEIVGIRQRDAHDGMSRFFKRGDSRILRLVGFRR